MDKASEIISPNILLIHFHSTRNAGDLAQLRVTIEGLHQWFQSPEIEIASNYPNEKRFDNFNAKIVPSVFHLVGMGRGWSTLRMLTEFLRSLMLTINELRSNKQDTYSFFANQEWRNLLWAYRKADIVISVPGNIFFTMGRFGFPFLISTLAVLFAIVNKKVFYVMPQSIGPLARWWERFLLRRIYKHARLLFTRESLSYNLAREIGIPAKILHLHVDQAFMITKSQISLSMDRLAEYGITKNTRAIGVTVIPRMIRTLSREKLQNFYRSLADSLTELSSRYGYKVYFFPQVTGPTTMEDDRIPARFVASLMKCPPEQVALVEDYLTDIELRSLYASMGLFIASRLHSGIFALMSGVPTLLIGYLPKALGIMNALDLGEYYIDLDTVSRRILVSKAEMLLTNREKISQEILLKISRSINHLTPTSKLIAENYHNVEEN